MTSLIVFREGNRQVSKQIELLGCFSLSIGLYYSLQTVVVAIMSDPFIAPDKFERTCKHSPMENATLDPIYFDNRLNFKLESKTSHNFKFNLIECV